MITATELLTIDAVLQELDRARRNGPLQHIVIPPCPELLTRLQKAMSEAEPDLNEVARIATSDVAMSATLLRAANSPAYSAGGAAVQTIGQAMNRLGLQRTAAVMTAFLARGAMKVTAPQLQRFWERSTKRAVAMSHLAERLPGISADLAHTYGLFCHVGMPVMAQSVKGYLGTMVEASARIDRSYVQTENANHRTDHAVVGALVSRLWRLAPSVTAAIRLHHDLEALGERSADPDVNALVSVGLLAEWLMRRHEALDPDADWVVHGATAMGWLHINEDDLNTWFEELQEAFDAV
ncbi:HDOD domain-containing protein [Aquabacterium parvum]|jgi:HD-like signal output (HDOD) protein|uniref:HDOD domain-containing protein n=1 Tax=Aquabacterium parvum TaxID=70584 RepID=UPI000AAE8F27|nr:HDOD domain-containing protein [Aquabacterium parvum]